jgi:hypothetical protein
MAVASFGAPSQSKAIFDWLCPSHRSGTAVTTYVPATPRPVAVMAPRYPVTTVAMPSVAPTTCCYVPQVAYRTAMQPVTTTVLSPVQGCDPCGNRVTTYRPVITYVQRPVLVPYTTYRAVYSTAYVSAPACRSCATYGSCGVPMGVPVASGCSSCGVPSAAPLAPVASPSMGPPLPPPSLPSSSVPMGAPAGLPYPSGASGYQGQTTYQGGATMNPASSSAPPVGTGAAPAAKAPQNDKPAAAPDITTKPSGYNAPTRKWPWEKSNNNDGRTASRTVPVWTAGYTARYEPTVYPYQSAPLAQRTPLAQSAPIVPRALATTPAAAQPFRPGVDEWTPVNRLTGNR